jgi:lipooligosaccharide transport system permease protein
MTATVGTIGRVFEHRALSYRRTWRSSIFTSFLSPVFFLAAMGLGLGGLVDASPSDALGGVPYVVFLAPGLLAATVMQTAAFESTFPLLGGLVWNRIFHAMHATPIEPRDIALGHLAWIAVRMTMISTIFVAVIVAFGAARSWEVVLGVPAAVLTGMAFAGPISAFSATQKTMDKFNALFRFGVTPLFLFSGTFFPVEQLPIFVQPIAWVTPLYHGVAVTRALSLGTAFDEPLVLAVHLCVLVAFVVGGAWLTVRAVERRMIR